MAGDPPVAVQANVYGEVPPDAEAVHDTAALTVPVAGHVTLAWSATALIETVADAVFLTALASVAFTLMVLLPFVE